MPSALDKPKARSLDSFPAYSGSRLPSPATLETMTNNDSPMSGLLLPSPTMERTASSSGGLSSTTFLNAPSSLRNFAHQLSSSLRSNRSSSENHHQQHCHHHHHHRHRRGHHGSERDSWKNRTEFILMLIGYTVGLGNVWLFPSLCYKNGGASFLIPYGIMLALEGIPLYYMELCIGQRMRKGSVGVWSEISPYLGGVGIASVVVCFLVSLYYNVIIAWCFFYFFNSFQNPLPWSECPLEPVTLGNITIMEPVHECNVTTPTKYFWYRTTLQMSTSIEDSGGINWKLCACLVGTWILIWLCMMKGTKITGKIVYGTATLPLILLIIFFFRGVHLKGYQEGLALLFIPKFDRLKDPLVWLEAAVQIFYSLGVAYGSLIAFSSYNPIKNDSTKDAITVCLINCATSIYASVVVFCFIGFQAEDKMQRCLVDRKEQAFRLLNHTGVTDIPQPLNLDGLESGRYHAPLQNASKLYNETLVTCNKTAFLEIPAGQGLAFIVFTEAINKMPFASLWSVMFFLMLIAVGIDTQFGMLEGVVTPVIDQKLFPKLKKEYISGIICLVCCLMGLPLVQHSGEYWIQLIISYCSGISLLIIALVECVAVSYIYGIDRFSDDIKYMTNKPPRFIWRWCWKVISPVTIFIVLAMSIKSMSESTAQYMKWDGKKGTEVLTPYPPWGKFLAIMLTLVSIFFIPAVALLRYFRIIDMGAEEIPAVVLEGDSYNMNDMNTSELQPLHNNKPKKNRKTRKLSLARRKYALEERLAAAESSETNKNGPLNRVITANGQVYQLVNQHNGATMFV